MVARLNEGESMLEYQPLDLSGLYNVGPEVYRTDYRAPLSAAFRPLEIAAFGPCHGMG